MTNICKYKIIQYLLCQQLTLIIKFAAPKGTSVKESKSDPVLSPALFSIKAHSAVFSNAWKPLNQVL